MDKKDTITEVLIIEHGKLREILARFIREIELEEEQRNEAWRLFREKEKRHVFIEENKLFNLDKTLKRELVKKLILQHIELDKIMANIEKKMKQDLDPTKLALDAQEFLRMHTDLEEKEFYSDMDKKIPANKKDSLISMIKELFGE